MAKPADKIQVNGTTYLSLEYVTKVIRGLVDQIDKYLERRTAHGKGVKKNEPGEQKTIPS